MASKRKASAKKKKVVKKLSDRKKKIVARKKKLQLVEKRIRIVDRELALIEKELSSSSDLNSRILDKDLKTVRRRLVDLHVEEKKGAETSPPTFYKKFVFRCKKCSGDFEQNIRVTPLRKKLVCPACGKDHTIGITPSSRFYHVHPSEHIEIRKAGK